MDPALVHTKSLIDLPAYKIHPLSFANQIEREYYRAILLLLLLLQSIFGNQRTADTVDWAG